MSDAPAPAGGFPVPFVGINWGSSRLRAWLIGPGATVRDRFESDEGIAGSNRNHIAQVVDRLATRWPEADRIIACGMIGSPSGWIDAGYVECPAVPGSLSRRLAQTQIGPRIVHIVPGLSCRLHDGRPDVLRGEETELVGMLDDVGSSRIIALPGTHTKWLLLADGCVQRFMTSLSGELFDRLQAGGLLAPLLVTPGEANHHFRGAVDEGYARQSSLVTRLFGERARVMVGEGDAQETASRVRGLLIGAELADARDAGLLPREGSVNLVGNPSLARLYQAALDQIGLAGRIHDAGDAAVRGLAAIRHAMPA